MKPSAPTEFERNCADAAGAPDVYCAPMIRTQMNRADWGIILFLALIWGGAFFFIAVAVRSVPPPGISGLSSNGRHVIATSLGMPGCASACSNRRLPT